VAWSATVVAFAAAGQAVGVQLTWGQAALLAAGVSLATAIPAGLTPGGNGAGRLSLVGRASINEKRTKVRCLTLVLYSIGSPAQGRRFTSGARW